MMATHPRQALDLLLRGQRGTSVFSDLRGLQVMLDFERALARAEARVGIIPWATAAAISDCCYAECFDQTALAGGCALSGNLAIPMVQQLTRLVSDISVEAAGYVHWGATSQDVVDTGCVLQLREFLDLLQATIRQAAVEFATLTDRHQDTPMAGRTWLQQAVPITFGLKTAGYVDVLLRHLERLDELRPRLLALQFGGAAGTLASLGDRGPEVAAALGDELQLTVPAISWHGHRDRLAEVATLCGLIVGSAGKIARDLSLMGQTEVAEASEPSAPGRGGSSTMPHKRNPVAAAVILSTAVRVPGLVSAILGAMVQEHERGLGGWHAEWETLPEICTLTLGALERLVELASGLEVDAVAMRNNLGLTRGLLLAEALSMALAKNIGKARAHAVVEKITHRALEERRPLDEVLREEAEVTTHFTGPQLDRLLDPANYTGAAGSTTATVLAGFRSRQAEWNAKGAVDHAGN
jgi:3-carboxy-cis,cis-muconate cycloisomerase